MENGAGTIRHWKSLPVSSRLSSTARERIHRTVACSSNAARTLRMTGGLPWNLQDERGRV